MQLTRHAYGKARVRVLRVLRDGAREDVREVAVQVMLEGDFAPACTDADNSSVVPTDTIKNTVHALARTRLGPEPERFALDLARHFVARHPQVHLARVRLEETVWERLTLASGPHPHAFTGRDALHPVTVATATRDGVTVECGLLAFPVFKSTGSGFAGFPRCEFTTLAETDNRILASRLTALWRFASEPASFAAANAAVRAALLAAFAENYSPSVQATLRDLAAAAFAAEPGVDRITLEMPNQHYHRLDLGPLGLDNPHEVFLPTDEPHGQIEATFAR